MNKREKMISRLSLINVGSKHDLNKFDNATLRALIEGHAKQLADYAAEIAAKEIEVQRATRERAKAQQEAQRIADIRAARVAHKLAVEARRAEIEAERNMFQDAVWERAFSYPEKKIPICTVSPLVRVGNKKVAKAVIEREEIRINVEQIILDRQVFQSKINEANSELRRIVRKGIDGGKEVQKKIKKWQRVVETAFGAISSLNDDLRSFTGCRI